MIVGKPVNNNPIVSVIIPVYNSEKFILRCLKSIETQNINNIEVIVVNDGSTDNSEKVILDSKKLFKNLRIKYVKQDNKGVSSARNNGIRNSNGLYIMFLDSDDYLPKNSVEIMLNNMDSNEIDIVAGQTEMVDLQGNTLFKTSEINEATLVGDEFLLRCLEDKPVSYSCCGKLYSRSFVGDSIFEEGRAVNEDSFFIFGLALRNPKVKIVNEIVYNYVKNPNSSSNKRFNEKFFDIIYFANLKREIVELDCRYEKYGKDIMLRAHINILQNLVKTDNFKKETSESIAYIKNNCAEFKAKNFNEKLFLSIVKSNLYFLFKLIYKIKLKLDNIKYTN